MCTIGKKRQGQDHRWPPFFLNQTTTNQKMEFVVGDHRGGRAMAVDGVRGGILACLGRQYRRQKNKKIQYVVVGDSKKQPKHTAARREKKTRFAADVEVRTAGKNRLSPTTDRLRVDVIGGGAHQLGPDQGGAHQLGRGILTDHNQASDHQKVSLTGVRPSDERAPIKLVDGRPWSPGVYQALRLRGRSLETAWEKAFIRSSHF